MKNDPLAAIREDDATGGIAALFADLRATLDVPFVTLIWRHLATMPGMLAWTWSVVKPCMRRRRCATRPRRFGLA